jgi:hypothetical protein
MTNDNLLIRSLHDVGVGAWFGGSLMGAIGLNGAANDIADPKDRSRIAASGWARWAPVNAVAIGAHLIGGAALIKANSSRVIAHSGSRWNTVVKTAVTGAALGATAYSGLQGKKVAQAGRVETQGGAVPAQSTPDDVAAAQQRLRLAQWAIPALTGVLIVLGAQQGEQQRPSKLASDIANRARRKLT